MTSFGISGSNGNAFSRATRVSMTRKASDTVSPIRTVAVFAVIRALALLATIPLLIVFVGLSAIP